MFILFIILEFSLYCMVYKRFYKWLLNMWINDIGYRRIFFWDFDIFLGFFIMCVVIVCYLVFIIYDSFIYFFECLIF